MRYLSGGGVPKQELECWRRACHTSVWAKEEIEHLASEVHGFMVAIK